MTESPPLQVPVLLLIFNRPETTQQVFNTIRAARPTQLYVAADGPRRGFTEDQDQCDQARRIATAVDWDCRLQTLFRDRNLGCGPAVSSAISWFFDGVEEGIVLEDDCVPSASFYRFCAALLDYYRDQPRVMHISGDNYQYGRRRAAASYYFSKYTHTWGWATWRRAWKHYDFTLIPEADRLHVWDAQWLFSVQKAGGLAALPNANLVSNIGAGPQATHSHAVERFLFLPAQDIEFPLVHPNRIEPDNAADRLTYYANFRQIRHLQLVFLYAIADFILLVPTRIGKLWRKLRTTPAAPSQNP